MLVILSSFAYAEEIIEFSSLPGIIETNIPSFPVTGRVPATTKTVYINGINTTFYSTSNYRFDFFIVVDLVEGINIINLIVIDQNGSEQIYSKQVEFYTNYSTEESELVYANSQPRDIDGITYNSILVIDTKSNTFIGAIKNKNVLAITKNGSEIILSDGSRYSTKNHSFTGRILPNFDHICDLVFSNHQDYLYHKYYQINLSSNLVKATSFPSLCYYSDITSDDEAIITYNGYINLTSKSIISKDYVNGRMPLMGNLRVDPTDKYVLHSSYGSATGELNVLDIDTTNILQTVGGGDYAGDIVFSQDGSKAYSGFYGNTWFGFGRIAILDMLTLNLDSYFDLQGSISLAVSKNGEIYSSAFYTLNAGKYLGKPEQRGIIKLKPINNGQNLQIDKVFFVSLKSTLSEPYYGSNNIFYKPGIDNYTCSSDIECGLDGWLGAPSCQNANVYQTLVSYHCTNPATENSYCSNITGLTLKQECAFGCDDGTCNKKPVSTGAIKVIGRKLFVDGVDFKIKAVGYAPVPIGYSGDSYDITVHKELRDRDFPLLRAMNTNAIRTWGKVNSISFLDDAWNNGNNPIRVIMGYWMGPERDYQSETIRQSILDDFEDYVQAYKDHPAVLVWAIGNEENNFYGGGNNEKHAAYFSLVDEMAKKTYTLEGPSYHPVVAVSLEIPGQLATVGSYAVGSDDGSIQYVDIWGINNYPIYTFGDFFDKFAEKTSKPLLITEYGIDALNNTNKNEYEGAHAEWVLNQWDEIYSSDVTIGGSLMAYSDEWWKGNNFGCDNSNTHGYCGYTTDSHPDNYANEEWWGIMRIVENGDDPNIMQPRQVYYTLMSAFEDKQHQTLKLNNGWNLVSINLNLTKNIADFLLDNFLILGYNGSWFYPEEIDVNDGYWIDSDFNLKFNLFGGQVEDDITLQDGWNLIGYPSLNETNISTFADEINVTNVFMYENGTWKSYKPDKPSYLNTITKAKPGYGYWVKVE